MNHDQPTDERHDPTLLPPTDDTPTTSPESEADKKAQEDEWLNQKMRQNFRKLTSESDDPPIKVSFKTIIGGDLLLAKWFRQQYLFILFLSVLCMGLIINRYYCELDMIQLTKLEDTLCDRRYKALTMETQYKDLIRPSLIEKTVTDTSLKYTPTPVYKIEIHNDKELNQEHTTP